MTQSDVLAEIAGPLREAEAARKHAPDPLEEQKTMSAYRMYQPQISAEETTRNQIIGYAIAGTSFLVGVIATQTMPVWMQLLLIIVGYLGLYLCLIREEARCRNIVTYTIAGVDAESELQRLKYYALHDARFSRTSFTRGESIFFLGYWILTALLAIKVIPHINQ